MCVSVGVYVCLCVSLWVCMCVSVSLCVCLYRLDVCTGSSVRYFSKVNLNCIIIMNFVRYMHGAINIENLCFEYEIFSKFYQKLHSLVRMVKTY